MLTQVFPEKPGQYGVSVRDEIRLLFFLVLWEHSRSSLCLLEGKEGERREEQGEVARGKEREASTMFSVPPFTSPESGVPSPDNLDLGWDQGHASSSFRLLPHPLLCVWATQLDSQPGMLTSLLTVSFPTLPEQQCHPPG